jgi:SAM-dependent methyltransferase
MMTLEQFAEMGLRLSREADVMSDQHTYFVAHCSRLYRACQVFGLLKEGLGDVLEIGPFYGYTPFLLRPNASSYTVLEGEDPSAYPLKPFYQRHNIQARFVDLVDLFGPAREATQTLNFADASFDRVLCWETMEHFNFNPVKFVREVHRILRPGGCACITVPNRASFQNAASLLFGLRERSLIDLFYRFEDHTTSGKKVFYGFHWHEYAAPEIRHLFSRAGFKIRQCSTLVAFQPLGKPSVLRRLVRGANVVMARLLPRYGTHVYLVAEK